MATVRLLPVGPVRCASQTWRLGSNLSATIIVKATFVPAASGALVLAPEAAPVCLRDEHWEQSPARSVEESSELAPFLPRGEVLLRGVAHATGGSRAVVRLVVARAGAALMDRRVVVRGDDARPGEALLVPLTHENAIGGAGHPQNPVGHASPLLLDPIEPSTPGSFGPIARAWKGRASLLDAEQRRGLAGPVWTLDGVPPEYFHAAPVRQRIAGKFVGDEEIWIDGVSANGARIHWRLPGVRAEARALWAGREHTPIELAADTLKIDTDKRRVSIVWRGTAAIDGGTERLVVATGVAVAAETIAWPSFVAEEDPTPGPSVRAPAKDQTGAFELKGLAMPTLPFDGPSAQPVEGAPEPRTVVGTPFAGAPPSVAIPAQPLQLETLHDPAARDALLAGVLQIAPPAVASPPGPAPRPELPAPPPALSATTPEPKPMIVELAPVTGGVDIGTLRLDRGLGSLLLFALRERLAAERSPTGRAD
ncbi:MAG: DUF2169 domain-containing protein [Polyangiaceae bacterium]